MCEKKTLKKKGACLKKSKGEKKGAREKRKNKKNKQFFFGFNRP